MTDIVTNDIVKNDIAINDIEKTTMTFPSMSLLPRRVAMALLALPLAACSNNVDRLVTSSTSVPDDFRARHPIVLANGQKSLDVFVDGNDGRIDRRQSDDLAAFARNWRREGQGPIQILLPRGSAQDHSAQAMLDPVRRELVRAGAGGSVTLGAYEARDPSLAAPIRLSYSALEARVDTRCGEWPSDLASGTSTKGWENRPYYNLGCAYQQNFAAQLSDPRDLVRPRQETPSDVQMRMRAIGKVREGEDPGTAWGRTIRPYSSIGTLAQ